MDTRVKDILGKYHPDPQSAVWQHKQSGQYLIKHKDIEIVAAKAGIKFDLPVPLQASAAEGVALVVTGHLEDRSEWSIGEASPKNTTQQYPYAMAEKRAKDRVVLKLLLLHGDIYSEDEMPDEPKIAPKAQKALDWANGYVATRDPSDGEEYDHANADKISAAAKYPEARKVLMGAEVNII